MFRFGSSSILRGGVAVAAALTVAGCDSATSSTSSATSTGGPVAIDNLKAELATTMCKVAECLDQWFSTPTGCAEMLGGQSKDMQEIVWVKAGLVTYDATQARACLTAMANLCMNEGAEPAACRLTFVGKIEAGAACDEDLLCKTGWCQKAIGSNCGVCTAPGAAGAACDGGAGCVTGLECIQGTCAATGSVAAGKPCNQDRDCVAGNFCKHSADSDVCVAQADAGGDCNTTSLSCKGALVCSADSSTGPGSTGKCGTPHKAGEACGNPFNSDCEKGLVCAVKAPSATSPTVVTKCVPRVKAGVACEFTVQCGQDGWCSGGKCAALPKVGEACTTTDTGSGTVDCGGTAYCGEDGKCKATPVAGEACAYVCAGAATCISNKCVANSAVGGACSSDDNGPRCNTGLFCGTDGKCSATPVCK